MMRNGPLQAGFDGGPEEVDEHGVAGDGYRPPGGVEPPAWTSGVDDPLAPRVPRQQATRSSWDLLLADPRRGWRAAVPGRRHVHDALVETDVPDGAGGLDEPLELLRDAGARIEGPRPLRDHRGDHVARAHGAPSPARLRRGDRRRARPARPASARRRRSASKNTHVEGPRPRRHRPVLRPQAVRASSSTPTITVAIADRIGRASKRRCAARARVAANMSRRNAAGAAGRPRSRGDRSSVAAAGRARPAARTGAPSPPRDWVRCVRFAGESEPVLA